MSDLLVVCPLLDVISGSFEADRRRGAVSASTCNFYPFY